VARGTHRLNCIRQVMRDRCANRTPNFDRSQRVTSPFLGARERSGEWDGFFDDADTHDLRALECLARVMDRARFWSNRTDKRDAIAAELFFAFSFTSAWSFCLRFHRATPTGKRSSGSLAIR
jgi:hypothetical protein